ncbi:MAG: NAD-dependent DNA ligase LigA, partial [Paramuribaculum sp.]|nr:NAD-dependent DNA ligase LigA [Paramuribaculum sp.]
LEHFVGRHMMDIDGIGEEVAQKLYDLGYVCDIADLYSLTEEKLLNVEGFKVRSAQRVLDGLKASLQVPFERSLYALSIPFVGETGSKKLARAVGSIDRLMAMSEEELTVVPDIGPRTARAIREFFAEPVNISIVNRLKEAGVRMEVDSSAQATTDRLQGKTFVISGVFAKHSREQYKDMIEANGGRNSGSISKKTDYVLAGDNMGPSKLEKASRLGIPVIDEDTFLAMIQDED